MDEAYVHLSSTRRNTNIDLIIENKCLEREIAWLEQIFDEPQWELNIHTE